MNMYASYQDYVERFGGRAIPDEADFNRLALRAGPVLERKRHDTVGIASEKVGDWQVQYRRIGRAELNAELAALAEMYLFGTGLLYRGIPAFSEW